MGDGIVFSPFLRFVRSFCWVPFLIYRFNLIPSFVDVALVDSSYPVPLCRISLVPICLVGRGGRSFERHLPLIWFTSSLWAWRFVVDLIFTPCSPEYPSICFSLAYDWNLVRSRGSWVYQSYPRPRWCALIFIYLFFFKKKKKQHRACCP